MLSNKVSVEELSRVLLTKSNIHEVNMELSSVNQRIEEIIKDYNKRLSSCCLQKDFNFLNSIMDKKADLDFVEESLNQKANKQSVANALHRKANRSDVEELLTAKVDIQELNGFTQVLE